MTGLIIRDLRRVARGIALIGVVILGVLLGSAQLVLWRASAVAAGRPACLVVAGPDGYRVATGLADLTVLRMQAPDGFGGLTYGFHGVLIVRRDDGGADMFNWSWRRLAFDPAMLSQANEALWPGADACVPGRMLAAAGDGG